MIFCAMSIMATAQQEFLSSFYDDGITAINPAAYRMEQLFNRYSLFASATYRHQWAGFDFAPRTVQVQVDGWLPDSDYKFWQSLGNTRAGFHFMMDDADPRKLYNAYGQFAHQIKLAGRADEPMTFLSLGLNLGLAAYHFNPINLDPISNPTMQNYEELVNISKVVPDAGVGILFGQYTSRDGQGNGDNQGFFMGVSVPHVLGAKFSLSEGDLIQFDIDRHYYAMVGGQFGAYEFTRFKPMVIMSYLPNAPFYLSGNLEVQVPFAKGVFDSGEGKMWLGGGLSIGKEDIPASFAVRIGFQIPYFSAVVNSGSNSAVRFGFGYVGHLGEVSKFGETYEITLAWMLDNR